MRCFADVFKYGGVLLGCGGVRHVVEVAGLLVEYHVAIHGVFYGAVHLV